MGKIGSGTKDVLYSISDNEPLAVDLNSKNELLPTLFFLSKFPTAVRQFVVHSPVSEYVLNGADLMMPGVCTAEGTGALSHITLCIDVVFSELCYCVYVNCIFVCIWCPLLITLMVQVLRTFS